MARSVGRLLVRPKGSSRYHCFPGLVQGTSRNGIGSLVRGRALEVPAKCLKNEGPHRTQWSHGSIFGNALQGIRRRAPGGKLSVRFAKRSPKQRWSPQRQRFRPLSVRTSSPWWIRKPRVGRWQTHGPALNPFPTSAVECCTNGTGHMFGTGLLGAVGLLVSWVVRGRPGTLKWRCSPPNETSGHCRGWCYLRANGDGGRSLASSLWTLAAVWRKFGVTSSGCEPADRRRWQWVPPQAIELSVAKPVDLFFQFPDPRLGVVSALALVLIGEDGSACGRIVPE